MSISNLPNRDLFSNWPVVPSPGRMTEAEYLAWLPEGVRAEWVKGEVIVMSPANREHSRLLVWLLRVIGEIVDEGKQGELHGPEMLARFADLEQSRLPDLLFVSRDRLERFRNAHYEGAPDMIMEIVSPDSVVRDHDDKYKAYEAAGVREYWIIDLVERRVDLYQLVDGKYVAQVETSGSWQSAAIAGLRLKTVWFWPESRPTAREALKEIGVD